MKRAATTVLMFTLTATGCAIPYPYPKGHIHSPDWAERQHNRNNPESKLPKALTEAENGHDYCLRLATNADSSSQKQLGLGIVLGVVAGAAVILGAAIGPDTSDGANWAAKNRNTLILGAGGLLSVPTTILLMRSKDAARASSRASLALTRESNTAQLNERLRARGEYTDARGIAANAANGKPNGEIKNELEELENTLKEHKDKLEELKKTQDEIKKGKMRSKNPKTFPKPRPSLPPNKRQRIEQISHRRQIHHCRKLWSRHYCIQNL